MDQIPEPLKFSRGIVVGIGKVKIPRTQELDYEIQLLSFLDIQESETSFISTCIHLRIDGYGKTIEEAEADMVESVYYFLCQNFQKLAPKDAWDNFRDLIRCDDWSNKLWDAYHEVQILLSMQGISTDNIANLSKCLEQLAKRVERLEARVKNMEQEKARTVLASEIRKLTKDLIVDRTPLDRVA